MKKVILILGMFIATHVAYGQQNGVKQTTVNGTKVQQQNSGNVKVQAVEGKKDVKPIKINSNNGKVNGTVNTNTNTQPTKDVKQVTPQGKKD